MSCMSNFALSICTCVVILQVMQSSLQDYKSTWIGFGHANQPVCDFITNPVGIWVRMGP